ncbi:uncharacterized protein PITG_19856 [Phytophthora infestans T30-4]|uniref:Uncharacterized protein n=2 Tax=Phytophthora infestans TaxID=4787 RepID=D0P0X2_PHYIT|nr:uncharacterized protein PITG_19856 [Phytophthora infestans T30-4]EEY53679.1 conserved hypothetical protein [Phytophthora infestans T30-4]KAF4029067.1 hypothetical protein GN244_ATG19232 [Phytophthora infestans]KAF4132200.1 hypothetical protein GN958_ATG18602 [Phytophthora infestans]KAI9994274.1 hypothetical protein PInf_010872 [Phytophthora infestans]|eukprot:XP_002896065.1 conserved hypothetical protein [Phytophthora infestans T30-4]
MVARNACWWLSPWKKLDQEWQAACARGQQQLAKLADSLQKTTYLTGEHWGSLADSEQIRHRASSRLWDLAHRCSKRLQDEVDGLADIFARMQRLVTDGQANSLDEKRKQRYGTLLLEVLMMYKHELVAKSLIASDIFECFKHETVTIYLASWQMQPHIDLQRLEELETLIQNDLHYQTQTPRR